MSKEAELIEAALQGDKEAFGQLVRTHQDRLFAAMLQVTRSAEEAEDVVQDAFVRAYLKLDTFQRNSRFFTWLYRIAFNSALSRRRRKRVTMSLDQTREVTGNEPIDNVDSPDERMLRGERVLSIQVALDQLSDEHRTILVLREMENHPYEDIAEILEISIGTVRSRLSRARTQLRLTLEGMQQ
ncbi:ECF RNA polymerase sigma factor SigW [Roseimaritima multifibrata]|uniref:RNA polymerase sigma factor n=1 Tax=Roseimaritima multifibrata TaxID=1930274 RepID=A0A517M983_9BACT|nr:sigma-70 family RNA polymerase sigma factor [Roseimaritima multifibrata]QDS91381.1 ECF RNA polymerase sigma factor SigW [Roseimaritima multifibrata]